MVHVTSEIGRLRRVLVHEPGDEVDRMVPQMMDELLFDDILFGERAREEHRRFRRLLQLLGIEAVEVGDLLVRSLEDPEARSWIWRALGSEVPVARREQLGRVSAQELAWALVTGVLSGDREHRGVEVGDLFDLTPLPNWCFQRDPQVVIGDGVVFSAMATTARWREGLLARCIFRFHPELSGAPQLLDPLSPSGDLSHRLGFFRPSLEGGDVLVLSDQVVAVGLSQRTNGPAIELLARALAAVDGGPRWLEIVHLPNRRAYMHLDTVITQVDTDAALVYPALLGGCGSECADTYEVDLDDADLEPSHRGDLLTALKHRGLDLEPIPCGGDDPLTQQREQWTDGANALALAPGVITLYDRNVATADELANRGWRVVDSEDVLLGRTEVSLDDGGRTCLLLASHEISRARGGPHCLTHPLQRDDPR